jgi:CDP-glucose 4,6-dehydratase
VPTHHWNPSSLAEAFAGKRCLVTGHRGFKGAWLSLWLAELGAEVSGYGLDSPCGDGLYPSLKQGVFTSDQPGDLLNRSAVEQTIQRVQPDYVFHLAAQPLVRQSYADPIGTLGTNVMGSAHVLEAVRRLSNTCHTIFVTSDKCYVNREWCHAYRESDRLGGKDPYSMSKAGAELVAESWRRSYFDNHPQGSTVTSVRAGNVIGGGDYSADRLVPDCLRAALAHQPLIIRSPNATRPWQHVLDCLHGYLVVASKVPHMPRSSEWEAFNFGPQDPHDHPVLQVAEAFFEAWPQATTGVQVVPAEKAMSEAGYLSVSIEKAQRLLNWQPVWSFQTAVRKTVEWYAARHLENRDMLAISRLQISQFTHAQETNYQRRSSGALKHEDRDNAASRRAA